MYVGSVQPGRVPETRDERVQVARVLPAGQHGRHGDPAAVLRGGAAGRHGLARGGGRGRRVRRHQLHLRPPQDDPRHRGAQDGLQAVLRGEHLRRPGHHRAEHHGGQGQLARLHQHEQGTRGKSDTRRSGRRRRTLRR